MRFLLFLFFSLLPVVGYSQSKITLSFRISDAETPCAKDSIPKNIVFQYFEEGKYQTIQDFYSSKCIHTYTISKVPGKFRIQVTSNGYEPEEINFEITEQTQDSLHVGTFYMYREEITKIDEITVTGIREKYITFDANKTTYTVKDNDMLSGGSTEEALKKIPGVIKGPGGDLTVNGKSMAIYIDSSPTGLSSDDLENLLQSIPASSIEKIEIITNPGASFEANTSGGVINIITNGKALRGLNGTATLNYRFNKNNKISPSVSLNTRLKDISLQLNSGFSYRERDRTSAYDRKFTSFSPSIILNQKNKETGYNRFYFFRPSANIRLNDKSNLLINYNFSHTHNTNYYTSTSGSNSNLYPIDLSSNSKTVNNNNNHEIITRYRTQLDTLGKNFDITAYYSYFDKNTKNKSSQNNLGINRYSLSDIDLTYNNFYAKTNFEIPFKKPNLTLNLGGKYSIANSSSSGKYNLLNSSPDIFNHPIYNSSLHFDYDEYQYAVYAEASKKINKLNITAGLRYENLEYKSYVRQVDRKINNTMDKLYPSVSLLYKITPIINFNASYRKSFSLPSYTSLDPNMTGYFDEYNTSTGNQYLQPEFYDNYEVSISAFNYLRLGFQYTYSKNINMISFETENNSLTVNQTTKTYNGMNNYNVSLGIPIPFGLLTKGKKFFEEPMNIDKMSFLYFYGMYNYYKLDDYPYEDDVKPIWFYAFYSQIALPKDFKLTAFYMFSSDNGYFRIYKAKKPFSYSTIELSKSFYDKTFKASFGADNLFNSSKINATIFSNNLTTGFYQKDDNRVYYFKLSFNFGRLRDLKRENTIIENEKKSEKDILNTLTPL